MRLSNRQIKLRRGDPELTCFWIGSLGNIEFQFPTDSRKVAQSKMEEIRSLLDKLNVHEVTV